MQAKGLRLVPVSFLLYVLFMSWLLPLAELEGISGSSRIGLLLAAIALFMLTEIMPAPSVVNGTGKVLVSVGIAWLMLRNRTPDGTAFLPRLLHQAETDFMHALRGQWSEFSPEFRLILFLLGCSLLIAVVFTIVVQKQSSFWLTAATLCYLLLLQLAAGLDTNRELVWTAGAGLLLAVLLRIPGLERTRIRRMTGRGWPFSWLAAGCLLSALILFAALRLAGPMEATVQPAQFDKWLPASWTSWLPYGFGPGTGSAVQSADLPLQAVSGYSPDDSRLGGGLVLSKQVAFRAKTDRLTYWRGASLSYYTGQGWLPRQHDVKTAMLYGTLPASAGMTGSYAPVHQEIEINDPDGSLPLFSGGAVRRITLMLDRSHTMMTDGKLTDDVNAGTVRLSKAAAGRGISFYETEAEAPVVNPVQLRKDEGGYPLNVIVNDLQLPADLPQSVMDLTRKITAGEADNYDKVMAVERYLQNHYAYNAQEASMPAPGEDFVSHFLFQQKDGYCDHFSTAMAVMLRTIGIPARWVKGYAPGKAHVLSAGEKSAGSVYRYGETVLEQQAHSWVEVYFPKAGWMPFDPTPGFSERSAVSGANHKLPQKGQSVKAVKAIGLAPVRSTGGSSERPAGQHGVRVDAAAGKGGRYSQIADYARQAYDRIAGGVRKWGRQAPGSVRILARQAQAGLSDPVRRLQLTLWTSCVLAMALSVLMLAALRKRIWLWWLLARSPAGGRKEDWLCSMDKVWRSVFKEYGLLKEGQTLREYAERLGEHRSLAGSKRAIAELAGIYEAARYGVLRERLTKQRMAYLYKALLFPGKAAD